MFYLNIFISLYLNICNLIANGDGFITCQEFTKCFFNMGFAERATELRIALEKRRAEELERKLYNEKKLQELEAKNALEVNFNFTDAEFDSALAKLAEAAWKYDKHLPGSPSLAAFEGESMLPHQFKEQLRTTLRIKLTPPELGALMSYFDAVCYAFLFYFILFY